jgi:hypothetical protein
MQVFQTAGVPPKSGKSIFAIIGCTQNSKDALANNVNAYRTVNALERFGMYFVLLQPLVRPAGYIGGRLETARHTPFVVAPALVNSPRDKC